MSVRVYISGALIASCLTGSLLSAAPLSVDEAIAMALRKNRTIQKAANERERAQARLENAGRRDVPELELGYSDDAWGNDEGEGSVEVALTQKFPVTSRLRNEKDITSIRLAMVDAEIREAKRQLAYRVERNVVQLAIARYTSATQKELVRLNGEIESFLKKQVERGESNSMDHMQARISGRQLAMASRASDTEAYQLVEQLTRLLGSEARVEVSYSLDLPEKGPGEKLGMKSILQKRPDYSLIEIRQREAGLRHNQASSERWKDLEVSVFVEQESAIDAPEGLEENVITGLKLAWPLPFRRQNAEAVQLTEIDQRAAATERKSVQVQIASEYRSARQLLIASHKAAASASEEIVRLAEQNYKALREAYQLGQVGLLVVRNGQSQLLESRRTEVEAIAAYHEARAQYRFVTGDYSFLTGTRENNHAK